jgi:hypothetical protein
MAIATAQILPNPHSEGNFNICVGVGAYSGHAAMALGGTVRSPLVKGTVARSNYGCAAVGSGANFTHLIDALPSFA